MASSTNKKRKQRAYENRTHLGQPLQTDGPDHSLFIQAHEADLVHGPNGAVALQSLEFRHGAENRVSTGDGLIQWKGRHGQEFEDFPMDENVQLSKNPLDVDAVTQESTAVWVDRYDARLLLEILPDLITSAPVPGSPGGWSDLPSDSEDTFFFSAKEVADYRREKRRRLIDGEREARLRAMRAEGGDEDSDPQEEWGGSDEEPGETQRELMRRTATHVLGSPNPAQLEMRILANHGADQRFSFLRGRWSRAWRLTKAKVQVELKAEEKRKEDVVKPSAGIGGLAGYGESDEEDDEEQEPENPDAPPPPSDDKPTPMLESVEKILTKSVDGEHDDAVKAARRARAREWSEQRRALKESTGAQN